MNYDWLNDKFYDNVLNPQYECDWKSIEDSQLPELADVLQDSTIIKMENITDGENICGIILYLKKQDKKFVIMINAPDYLNEGEKKLNFEFISEE